MLLLGFTVFLVFTAISGTDYICGDDETVDCAKMNSIFDICGIKHKAKTICKKYCNLCDMVDGNWSPYSPWAKCDVTCGKGTLLRSRTCDNPAPQNGGLDCAGKAMELKTCNMPLCPVHGGWTLWGQWGNCSSTCGVGMRSRSRSCTNPLPKHFGDHCFGDSIQDELCNSGSCAVHGGWTLWGQWGACSSTCGVGMRSRSRSCTNPLPQHFGDHCFGDSIQDELCNSGSCAVDGGWTVWSLWGKCSVSCGVGLQCRSRSCTNPSPTNAGNECTGQNMEVTLCYPYPGLCAFGQHGNHGANVLTIMMEMEFKREKGLV